MLDFDWVKHLTLRMHRYIPLRFRIYLMSTVAYSSATDLLVTIFLCGGTSTHLLVFSELTLYSYIISRHINLANRSPLLPLKLVT
jgi:hypothetical protein